MNKNVFKVLAIVLCIAGCGGTLKETVSPSGVALMDNNQNSAIGVNKVAVFPFSDYSHQQSALRTDIWGGNVKILEEVTDFFVARGIQVAIQEDVNSLLVDNNIIQPLAEQQLMFGTAGADTPEMRSRIIGTPEYDLVNIQHSDEMQDAIIAVIKTERALEFAQQPPVQTPVLQGASVGLTMLMCK